MPNGYTRTQIALHWVIFLLIAAQFVFHDAISEAYHDLMKTGDFVRGPLVAQHIFSGILILALAIWRIVLKLKRGAPALPEDEPRALQIAAHATHGILYLLLLLVPISGGVAWFASVKPAAEAHEVLKTVLLLVVLIHFLGALFQKFVLKSNVMERMLRPNP